jgi:hypothetical protein
MVLKRLIGVSLNNEFRIDQTEDLLLYQLDCVNGVHPRLFHVVFLELNDCLVIVIYGQLDLRSEVFYHDFNALVAVLSLRRLLLHLVELFAGNNGAINVTA